MTPARDDRTLRPPSERREIAPRAPRFVANQSSGTGPVRRLLRRQLDRQRRAAREGQCARPARPRRSSAFVAEDVAGRGTTANGGSISPGTGVPDRETTEVARRSYPSLVDRTAVKRSSASFARPRT